MRIFLNNSYSFLTNIYHALLARLESTTDCMASPCSSGVKSLFEPVLAKPFFPESTDEERTKRECEK